MPECKKCHARLHTCSVCKGRGNTGMTTCSTCRNTGVVCPTHGAHHGG
jgi:hypothetical protein